LQISRKDILLGGLPVSSIASTSLFYIQEGIGIFKTQICVLKVQDPKSKRYTTAKLIVPFGQAPDRGMLHQSDPITDHNYRIGLV
jgi:hypothetical protein